MVVTPLISLSAPFTSLQAFILLTQPTQSGRSGPHLRTFGLMSTDAVRPQCYNLRARGVRAELINAATSQGDSRTIMKKMVSGGSAATAKGKGKGKAVELSVDEDEREIKLVYVSHFSTTLVDS